MKEISLCMIVKNEESVIGRCLECVKGIVDEIIIVDTGSTDKTKEIVSNYTDKIYDFEWVDDFSKARNFSFSKATKDYIMWLDADDVIYEEEQEKLKKLKEEIDGTVDIYQMKYNYRQDEKGNPTFIQTRSRLLKREKNYQWKSPIHEVITPTGNVKKVDIWITHKKIKVEDPKRNINIFEKMIANGEKFDDRQEYSYARELYGQRRYEEAIIKFEEFIQKYKDNWKTRQKFLYQSTILLADAYKATEEYDKMLDALFTMTKYEIPTSECCCKIGDAFLKKKQNELAIYWYLQAIRNEQYNNVEGRVNKDFSGFFPYINLGVCYFRTGNIQLAQYYNELAGKIKPDNPNYLGNKRVYEKDEIKKK